MKFERRVHSIVELLELLKVQLDHYSDDIKFLILFAVKIAMAGFRPNSEIIGKFRKLKKFYGHFVKRQK